MVKSDPPLSDFVNVLSLYLDRRKCLSDVETVKILLADDDNKIHLIVRMWLGRNGHEVVSAYNGRDALEILRESAHSFDGLITDINMPLLKGVDLVKEVLKSPHAPALIVVLTSRCDKVQLGQQLNDQRESDGPIVHFFNKPFSPAELARLIEDLNQKIKNKHESEQADTPANS